MLFTILLPALAQGAAAGSIAAKNIDISLTAKWAETPIIAEAAEFMADEGATQFWGFVEGMAALGTTGVTDRGQLEAVETVAAKLLSPLGLQLLRILVTAHVNSARVEMWRQLAATEAVQHGISSTAVAWMRSCGAAHAVESVAELDAALTTMLAAVAQQDCHAPETAEERALSHEVPLSIDRIYGGSTGAGVHAPQQTCVQRSGPRR